MSRDSVAAIGGDRRLCGCQSACPSCGARAGARCQTAPARAASPARCAARRARLAAAAVPGLQGPPGRAVPNPARAAPAGRTPRDFHPARRELHAIEDVWRALERTARQMALVRFSGGGGRQGTLDRQHPGRGRELARCWGAGEAALADALAAPSGAATRCSAASHRSPGCCMWDVRGRGRAIAGKRGGRAASTRSCPRPADAGRSPRPPTARHVARHVAAGGGADTSPRAAEGREPRARASVAAIRWRRGSAEARYCSKRCRQAASRARLRERSGRAGPAPPERCALCEGPMPTGLRPEARYCSKRCRQAASRARLGSHADQAQRPWPLERSAPPAASGVSDMSRDVSPAAMATLRADRL